MKFKKHIIYLVILLSVLTACEEDEFTTSPSARLSFSTDILNFDTVFTTIGSATRRLMVYNKNNKAVRISSVELEGSAYSAFKMNVDGISGVLARDIEIQANDSAYIFVQVTVDPTNKNSPLVINDNIIFNINSNQQKVILEAWGQDVHLLRDISLPTQTLETDKPYLIYGSCLVDKNQELTIPAGVTIYFHNKSRLWVAGKLISNGTLENQVTLRSDRLDYVLPKIKYDKFAGQWDGVYIMPGSKGNKLNYTNISNAVTGILMNHYNLADTFRLWVNSAIWQKKFDVTDSSEIALTNCKITTHSYAGILAYNSIVNASNCIIANCNQFGVAFLLGGRYEFNHCTLANYSKSRSEGAVVFFQDFLQDAQKKTYTGVMNQIYFGNSVIYGSGSNEVLYNVNNDKLGFKFKNCLLRIDNEKHMVSDAKKFDKVVIAHDFNPGFKLLDSSTYVYNFEINKNFLGKDKGNKEIAKRFPFDYRETRRDTLEYAPDCGAYEFK